jgi:hypothetical protein
MDPVVVDVDLSDARVECEEAGDEDEDDDDDDDDDEEEDEVDEDADDDDEAEPEAEDADDDASPRVRRDCFLLARPPPRRRFEPPSLEGRIPAEARSRSAGGSVGLRAHAGTIESPVRRPPDPALANVSPSSADAVPRAAGARSAWSTDEMHGGCISSTHAPSAPQSSRAASPRPVLTR